MQHIGLKGRVFDVVANKNPIHFTDEVKDEVFINSALKTAMICPICKGKLDPRKSVTYDHIQRIRDGGKGLQANAQIVHPYCNSSRDLLESRI